MNVLHINTLADKGGAAVAMQRVHEGLKAAGHVSRILTRSASQSDSDVYLMAEETAAFCTQLDEALDLWGRAVRRMIGFTEFADRYSLRLPQTRLFQEADVINLHNIHGGFFNYYCGLPIISQRKPVVWTLHDMWPLTGHCAYSFECERWKRGCYDCPLLKPAHRKLVQPSPTRFDVTKWVWHMKRKAYQRSRLHVITPSRWLRRQVEDSQLGQHASVVCIPHGIDLQAFHPLDRADTRHELDIPLNARVLMFSAHQLSQERKGFRHLLEALDQLALNFDIDLWLLALGEADLGDVYPWRFRFKELGYLNNVEDISRCYAAADVFVLPTLADNQPLVVLEALACGTPIVAFNVGGVPEMVRHLETGYLAEERNAQNLARGIHRVITDDDLLNTMRTRCREVAEDEYTLSRQIRQYLEVYEEVTKSYIQ